MMDGITKPKERPRLMDEREASRYLGVSPRSLWQLRKDRKIAFVPIGGRVLYDPADLEAFIAQQRRPASPVPTAPAWREEKTAHPRLDKSGQ